MRPERRGASHAIRDEIRVATAALYVALAEEITRRAFEATPQTSSSVPS
jgi:hypothetical protein